MGCLWSIFISNVEGDSILPLLFCLALNLNEILMAICYGYTVKSGQLVQHLLYMDNLKLCAKSERDPNALIPLCHCLVVISA